MHRVVELLIRHIKNPDFVLDRNISMTYLLGFIFRNIIMGVWGLLCLRRLAMTFVHPSSKILCKSKIAINGTLRIDRNCYIDALSVEGISFGRNVSIGKHTVIECSGTLTDLGKGLVVGDNVGLGTHGFFGCAGGVKIGNDCILGNFVSFHSENHNFMDCSTPIRLQGISRKGIEVGSNCWIGAKVTFLDGAVVGNGCIVAAGTVVRGVFPDNVVIAGVPARIVKCRCNEEQDCSISPV